MEAVLDKYGRIIIPKKLRDAIGLKPGSILHLEVNNQEILLKPVDGAGQYLTDEDGWLVYTGGINEDVSSVISDLRESRNRDLSGFPK